MTERIQRRRVKGWRMPEGAVYVGRPSKWGNPYDWSKYPTSRVYTSIDGEKYVVTFTDYQRRAWALTDYKYQYLEEVRRGIGPEDWPTFESIRAELAGKDLVCWCAEDQPCHADVLLRIARGEYS